VFGICAIWLVIAVVLMFQFEKMAVSVAKREEDITEPLVEQNK
jgi:hypothetical protein